MVATFGTAANTVPVQETTRSEYEFLGYHLVASYSGCDLARLQNKEEMLKVMKSAVEKAGATLLDTCHYTFDNGAYTAVMLLSESHASIHTYPEVQSCFVDLFTCGTTCDPRKFHTAMKRYLRPAQTAANIFERNSSSNEVADRSK